VDLLVDESIVKNRNLVVGKNKKDWHVKNWNFERDLNRGIIGQFSFVQEGDMTPCGSEEVTITRGVEVGNIFQLGTRYSESMGATYLDENGKQKPFIMGCYGIGVGRLLACLIEEHHDDYGPIWPMPVAPFQVHLCMLDKKKEGIEEAGEKLYKELLEAGVEVIFDDRNEKAGFQFADADLIGVPLRLVISKKSIKDGEVEYSFRGSKDKSRIKLEEVCSKVQSMIEQEMEKFY